MKTVLTVFRMAQQFQKQVLAWKLYKMQLCGHFWFMRPMLPKTFVSQWIDRFFHLQSTMQEKASLWYPGSGFHPLSSL